MKARSTFAVLMVCVGIGSSLLVAQHGRQTATRDDQVVYPRLLQAGSAANTTTFSLVVSVRDQDGAPPRELSSTDLDVRVDGKSRPIRSVGPAGPFSLLLLVDTSASMTAVVSVRDLREGLTTMTSQLGPSDRLRMAAFNADVELGPDFGSALPTILGFVNTISYRNATRLYDGLASGLATLEHVAGRRVVVVVSDGSDTDSRLTGDEVLRRVRGSDVQIAAVLPRNPRPALSGRAPDKALLRIIADTGGTYVQPKGLASVASALSDVVRDVQEQFRLEVEATRLDGKPHELSVRSKHARWTVRAARSSLVRATSPE